MEDEKKLPEGLRLNHGKAASASPDLKIVGEEIDAIVNRMKNNSLGYSAENIRRDREREIAAAEARIVDAVPSVFKVRVLSSPPRPEVEALKQGKTVLILGAVGTGKTTIAFSVAYQYLSWVFRNRKERRVEYSFFSEAEYFARLLDRKAKFEDFAFKESTIKKSLVVFDDLLSRSNSNFEHSELLFLVDGRYKWLQPTIYTSNKSLNEIGNFDDRIASRLASGIVIKTGSEEDFRLIKNT